MNEHSVYLEGSFSICPKHKSLRSKDLFWKFCWTKVCPGTLQVSVTPHIFLCYFSLIGIFITNLKLIKEGKSLQPWNKVLKQSLPLWVLYHGNPICGMYQSIAIWMLVDEGIALALADLNLQVVRCFQCEATLFARHSTPLIAA